MSNPDPDAEDAAALNQGESEALNRIMDRHGPALYRLFYRQIGNHSDAQELVQETFIKVFRQISSYRPTHAFRAWLYRIALNLGKDHFRSRRHRETLKNFPLSSETHASEVSVQLRISENPSSLSDRRDLMNQVQAAIRRLPLPLQAPFILTALEGKSHAEAGQILGLSSKAVEVKVRRAKEKLKADLSKRLSDSTG